MSLTIRPVGFAAQNLRVAVFSRPNQGARCWFSLSGLYEAMCLKLQSTAPRWVASKIKSWAKLMQRMGFDAPHLRPGSMGRSDQGGIIEFKVLSFPSASSFATIAIIGSLAGGCRNNGGFGMEKDIRVAKELVAVWSGVG